MSYKDVDGTAKMEEQRLYDEYIYMFEIAKYVNKTRHVFRIFQILNLSDVSTKYQLYIEQKIWNIRLFLCFWCSDDINVTVLFSLTWSPCSLSGQKSSNVNFYTFMYLWERCCWPKLWLASNVQCYYTAFLTASLNKHTSFYNVVHTL